MATGTDGEQAAVDEEVRRRRRNEARLRKEEEERRLIEEGSGPRKAKTTALKNAVWNDVEGRKRPRSPSPEEDTSAQLERGRTNEAEPPRRKRLQTQASTGQGKKSGSQSERGRERDEREEKRKVASQPKVNKEPTPHPNKTYSKRSNKTTKSLTVAINRRGGDASDSSSLSTLSGSESPNRRANGDGSDSEGGGGCSNDDDDDDIAQLSAKEAQKRFDNEMPKIIDDAGDLFKDDHAVEFATKNRRGSSSEASMPPTSGSEAYTNGMSDNDDDDHDDEDSRNLARVIVSTRKRRIQSASSSRVSKRDKALDSERPQTVSGRSAHNGAGTKRKKSTAAMAMESEDDQADPETKWPKTIQLNVGGLSHQRDSIRTLCRDAIRIVEKTLVTQEAWPELNQGMLYRRQVLLEAIKALRAKTTNDEGGKKEMYRALKDRISSDDNFVRLIGKWVVDRLSSHRGQMRSAASDHIAIFQLGVGDTCSKRVQALLENDVYVYPGHWAVDKDGKHVWMAKISSTDVQIYLNSALIDLIKSAFFSGPTAFGYKFTSEYVSTHPSLKEPELTISIVALGATAFFAALYEWREGKKVKSSSDKRAKAEKFEGDNFKKVYDRHVATLETLQRKTINTFHKIMSTLYSKIVDVEANTDSIASIKGSALAVLDLDGLD